MSGRGSRGFRKTYRGFFYRGRGFEFALAFRQYMPAWGIHRYQRLVSLEMGSSRAFLMWGRP